MKNSFLLSIFLVFILLSCQAPMQEERVQSIIDSTRADFAPDKRIALFDIHWDKGILTGETNLPDAHQALIQKLTDDNITVKDSVILLPEPGLGEKTLALVTNSVANIRSEPKHSAELATQALMGTPLNVLKESGSWYLVQTPDDYISWVDEAAIVRIDQQTMDEWMGKEKVVVTEMISNIYTDENQGEIVSDITAGNVLEIENRSPQGYKVALPDGRKGFIAAEVAVPYDEWINSRSTDDTSLVQTAKLMMGSPYLWGGTSPKGMDCSGFTKTIYFLNGMVIPRDASQQILEGELIDSEKNWENLEVGDLLFFGVPAMEDSRERVVHVGMWIGDNQFIHSRGRVRVSSFDPNDENYDAYELGRYLRTKRIRQKLSERIVSVDQILN
ncbi:C40 family peptidase [Cyclobacterium jeungdonense]|uniref:C40 family peptidase n=1 Tax=Cyclobacterium jeungdonense TaxID=708087 RepID=A0ABT8CDS3_9BACT|nr:C40 family peptidase [Cyclobacterium jeungdonense]MDN3689943.1 C40 family peptidase [Cyclobacterium jeungdonense]